MVLAGWIGVIKALVGDSDKTIKHSPKTIDINGINVSDLALSVHPAKSMYIYLLRMIPPSPEYYTESYTTDRHLALTVLTQTYTIFSPNVGCFSVCMYMYLRLY